MNAHKTTQFIIGDPVVYPQQGLGVIRSVKERVHNDQKVKYYEIYMESQAMTILIPVDRAQELGLRNIVSKKEALDAIANISSKAEPCPSDWKTRYQRNQELINKGTIGAIAKVVQTLYHRSKVKELPIQERKLYENALELLINESSYATGKGREEISTMILSRLEKRPSTP